MEEAVQAVDRARPDGGGSEAQGGADALSSSGQTVRQRGVGVSGGAMNEE